MKKTVKSLIIAASVAAIAGIGAVSFAAWNGGTLTTNSDDVTTGHRSTVGFNTETAISLGDDLLPYDQDDAATGETTMYNIPLKIVGNDVADYTLKGRYTATKTGWTGWSTAAEGADANGIYYLIDQNATATYANTWTAWTPATDTNNAALTLGSGVTLDAGDYYVHVALVSDNAADMDVALTFYFELAE